MTIAIIIMAKGNSKRIPRKNLKEFAGKPLLEHTLQDAKELDLPIYLITEDKEIKALGEKHEVNIIHDKYIKKHDHNNMVYEHVHDTLEHDAFILLQPTSPLRNVKLIKQWITGFVRSDADCGVSVYRMPKRYYYALGQQLNFDQQERDYSGCEKESLFTENGSFYIFKREMLKKKHILTTDKKIYFQDTYCIDLDELFQWMPSEAVFNQVKGMS